MKKTIFITFFALQTLLSFAQEDNWALGFRAGEPLGLNIRKYFNGTGAFELNIGTYGFLYNKTRAYRKGEYKNAGFMLQGHLVRHTALFNQEAFRGHIAYGGQINTREYYATEWVGKAVESKQKLAFGPTASAGLEYFMPNKLSIFVDGGVYVELLPAPLFFNPQFSAGVRLNLK